MRGPGGARAGKGAPVPEGDPERDEVPGGLFPTWGSLYATLIVWGILCIGVLYLLTRTLNVDLGTPGMAP